MIVKNRIAGTRITIWDVLHYLEAGWSRPDIAATLHLTEAQVAAAAALATGSVGVPASCTGILCRPRAAT